MASHWNYEDNGPCGPCHWPGDIHGKSQSPIDIDLAQLTKACCKEEFVFKNYDVSIEGQFLNNGHSVQFIQKGEEDVPTISGGKLDQEYRFIQYHYHWAQHDHQGSEHTLNTLHFPIELHLVHQGITDPSKLAVVGVFFKVGEKGEALFSEEEALPFIVECDSKVPAAPQRLVDKLPKNLGSFIRYAGSLTTPPCSEIVTWTVITTPITISRAQLEAFRKIKDCEHKVLEKNFRPCQALNNRKVYFVS
uniref:Carbonic anhydrase n=1 Tax=Rhabditophanes sp. KR3021 TaxID=114890 RepID=A0AC35TMV7_9BILA